MTLDSILDWAMPVAIIIFFVGIIYIKVKDPADQFLRWIGGGIKNMLFGGAEATRDAMNTEIVYN